LPSLQADLDEEKALSVEFSRLKAQLTEVRLRRQAARLRIWDKLKRLKMGIRGTYGDDSPEYKLIGGTRKSERKPYTYRKKE
jgi:hypothetical protein